VAFSTRICAREESLDRLRSLPALREPGPNLTRAQHFERRSAPRVLKTLPDIGLTLTANLFCSGGGRRVVLQGGDHWPTRRLRILPKYKHALLQRADLDGNMRAAVQPILVAGGAGQSRVWAQWDVDGCAKGTMRGLLAIFLTRASMKATLHVAGESHASQNVFAAAIRKQVPGFFSCSVTQQCEWVAGESEWAVEKCEVRSQGGAALVVTGFRPSKNPVY
jgi:hypothetical protein